MTGGLESATVGIQNREKTDGLTVVYDAPYVHDSLAVVIPEPKPTWLFANPTDFEIPAGGSANLNVVLTSVGVPDGDHTGAIGITTDDPEHRFVTLPVALHVGTAEAAFALDPEHRSPAVPSGWVAGRLSGLDPCAPAAIRPASILAMDVVGLAPGSTVGLLDCGALDFRRMEMLANVPEGAASEIDVVGEVANETWFRALGTLWMQRPRLTRPAGRYAAGTSVALSWTDASGSPASRYDLWFSPDSGATWSPVASGLTLHAFAWTVPATFTNQGFLELLAHATSNGAFVGTTFSGPFGIDAPATAAPGSRRADGLRRAARGAPAGTRDRHARAGGAGARAGGDHAPRRARRHRAAPGSSHVRARTSPRELGRQRRDRIGGGARDLLRADEDDDGVLHGPDRARAVARTGR